MTDNRYSCNSCQDTGLVTVHGLLFDYDEVCDNCEAHSVLEQRRREERETARAAYNMRGFGVAIEVRDHIRKTLRNPRAAAWPGQVY